ncbi:HNH endonuclease [Arthrobacter zhaoxinii]|uniref:HNH endonuclease n=1 Tax=Arthrobacter zhaoxinii TaxID=2964616 RepID=UPI00210783B5|nr:HNH endonuclease signature motif containing protein [Arthrobacter zhaoxinii]MCQ2001222.1 HNH endonuclease [Arthrobacter zhaoxinii]
MGLELPGVFCVSAGDAPAAGTVLPPGLMGMLSLQSPEELGQEAALQTLERLNAVGCWVQAQQARTVYRLQELTAHNLYPHPDPYPAPPDPVPAADAAPEPNAAFTPWDGEWVLRTTAAEIGALLCLPGVTAQRLVADSEQLCTRCPETLALLEHGGIDYRRARTVVEQTGGLRLEDGRLLEAKLLPLAPGKTGPQFDRTARRMREGMFPHTIPERHRRAAQDRRVWVEDLPDGIGVLSAFLPAATAHGIFNGLTVCARGEQKAGDSRTLDQLRADVLVAALTGQETRSMAAPTRLPGTVAEPPAGMQAGSAGEPTAGESWPAGGLRAEVMVLVSAESLLGFSNAPAELNGYGPISAGIARELLASMGRWTGLLQSGDGEILAVGRRRRIPPALKRWLQARDGTCRFPGCSVAAENCELDHTLPWASNGPTEHGNLAHLCRKHHRFKTVGLWKARQPAPGVIEWTSPMGRIYRTDAQGSDFNGSGTSGAGCSGTVQAGTGGPSREPDESTPPF